MGNIMYFSFGVFFCSLLWVVMAYIYKAWRDAEMDVTKEDLRKESKEMQVLSAINTINFLHSQVLLTGDYVGSLNKTIKKISSDSINYDIELLEEKLSE